MALNSGTGITDPSDMLDKLANVVTSSFVTGVTINSAGTGYAVGEIVDLDDVGASGVVETAAVEILTESGGVPQTIRLYRAGAYGTAPTATAQTTTTRGEDYSGNTGLTGSGLTVDLTGSAPVWTLNRRTQEAVSATVSAGGSGYSIGDLLTVSDDGSTVRGDAGGNTSSSTSVYGDQAVFEVATLSGSAVATVTLVTPGNYEEVPTNSVATTNDGSGDNACTLDVTWQDATFANNEFQVCLLQGEGLAGLDEIYVGVKTYSRVNGLNTAYNWSLHGFTGFDSALAFHEQSGANAASSGAPLWQANGGIPTTQEVGSYIALKDDTSGTGDPLMDWWIHHNGRRIIMVVRCQEDSDVVYSSMTMGLANQFATDSEYAYPMWICGGFATPDHYMSTEELLGGITEVYDESGSAFTTEGGGWLLNASGVWEAHANASSNSTSNRTWKTDYGIFPLFQGISSSEPIADHGGVMFVGSDSGTQVFQDSNVPGNTDIAMYPTPGSSTNRYWLVAPIIVTHDSFPTTYQMHAEVDGIFWFHTGGGGIVSEDRFEYGSERYIVFQNGNRTNDWSYFALNED